MTPLTDDELGALLTGTFTAHEHLADPERARVLATDTRTRRPRRAPVLLAAAASVALVAGGTAYVLAGGSDNTPVAGPDRPGPTTGGQPQPPLPPLQSDARNRALASAAADRVAASLPVYPGAGETDAAGVPELGDNTLSSVHPTGHTVVRSRFWKVSGVRSRAVAEWYAAHPAAGFVSEGGVGGEGDGHTWIDEVAWDQPQDTNVSQSGTSVEVATTNTAAGVGIRLTVSSAWLPARPVASYVQDVSSVDVRSTHVRYGRHVHTTHRSFTVRSPTRVLRAAAAYNDLPGLTPILMSCPMIRDQYTDRIVFHTATGDVTAVDRSSACGFGMIVRRDGHLVEPQLGDPLPLLRVLGLHH
jgi:hypothetical protein